MGLFYLARAASVSVTTARATLLFFIAPLPFRQPEAARRYFLDERDDIKNKMLADFALNPPLFRLLWVKDKWQDGIPADPVARSHLKVERGLNDQSAWALLSVLKETIQFAGLKAGIVQDEALESASIEAAPSMAPAETMRGSTMEQQAFHTPPATPLVNILPTDAPDVRIVGDRVVISANLDLKGLRKLRRQITVLEEYLTMSDEDDDEEPRT